MNIRTLLIVIHVSLCCVLTTLFAPSCLADFDSPNVIMIVTDDQGYGDMACHGNPWLKTPNLDRLYAESVRLEDYHVDPVCTPTRAALMTGRYSSRVGAWAVTEGRQLLGPDEITMANVFSDSGYRTGLFGKWHLGDTWPYAPRFRGFQDVVCHRAGGVDEIGNPDGNDFFDDTYFRNGAPEKFQGYCTDIFFDECMRFVREESSKPFFAYLPLNAMHGPHNVASKYSDPFAAQGHPETRSKFYGMITNFDENLGRLFDQLNQQDLQRNTILIFMGDNGTAAGGGATNRPDDGFNAGMRAKKGSVYEGGHRVACFVRWPAELVAGTEIQQLTSQRDWMPTLIDLCHLSVPENVQFDGQSIAPLLKGKSDGWPSRTLFVERQADQPELWQAPEQPQTRRSQYPHYAVMTEQWRLVDGELYDIVGDPGQKRNVAGQYPKVASQLYLDYQQYFADVFADNAVYHRFQLGTEQENPTLLTVRDWHPTNGRVIWKKEQLGDDDLVINGFWAVSIVQEGRFSITLARHPSDAPGPMKAKTAKLKIGDQILTQDVAPNAVSVTFNVQLKPGDSLLQTWLTDADSDTQRGAYYIQIRRLD